MPCNLSDVSSLATTKHAYHASRHNDYQSLYGNAPGYLADDCPLVADAHVRQLRSANLEYSLSVGRAAVLATGPLPPQDHKSGTVCCPISHYMHCHMASSGSY